MLFCRCEEQIIMRPRTSTLRILRPLLDASSPTSICARARSRGEHALDDADAWRVLDGFDVPGTAHRILLESERAAIMAPWATAGSSAAHDVVARALVLTGVEMFVDMIRDSAFGAFIAVGLGGAGVPIDVRCRPVPVSERDAEDLLASLFERGEPDRRQIMPPPDLAALRDVVVRLSELAVALPGVVAVSLNPMLALPAGCWIVEAQIRIGE